MNNKTNIRLVDAHSKGNSGHYNVDFLLHKILLNLLAYFVI